MKPTDKERREVARKLRESRSFVDGLGRCGMTQNVLDTFERILECVGYETGNVFDFLADLIDPTCRACLRTLLHPATEFTPEFEEDVYVCSECGEVLSYDEDFDPDTDYPAYCESCGFRVAEIGEPCSE